MIDHFVNVKDHGRVHYLEAGQGAPLILMHSNGNSAYEYDEMMPLLAGGHRVIAVDYPGHGDSEPLRRHYSVPDYADMIIAFMDALKLPRASIMGSSIGGAVAVDIGVRHAERVEKLFVVESPVRTPEQWAERWLQTEKTYAVPVQTADQIRSRFRNLTDALLDRWNIDRSKAGTWAMTSVMWALREYDVLAAIPKIRAKTIAIYGEKSPHPHGLDIFAKLLPQAERRKMADCGHFPMLDDPAELARVMDNFIKS
jgi:pimeloyl-ACP methyl ester carboxylesterase